MTNGAARKKIGARRGSAARPRWCRKGGHGIHHAAVGTIVPCASCHCEAPVQVRAPGSISLESRCAQSVLCCRACPSIRRTVAESVLLVTVRAARPVDCQSSPRKRGSTLIVIPAKAGIQASTQRHHWIPAFAGMTAVAQRHHWIPAFAGMTVFIGTPRTSDRRWRRTWVPPPPSSSSASECHPTTSPHSVRRRARWTSPPRSPPACAGSTWS